MTSLVRGAMWSLSDDDESCRWRRSGSFRLDQAILVFELRWLDGVDTDAIWSVHCTVIFHEVQILHIEWMTRCRLFFVKIGAT